MKPVIDVCCGSRMFWFDKQNPAAVFMDNRDFSKPLCDGRMLTVKPDVKADFRHIPYEDNSFHWNETQVKLSEILHIFGLRPLFGHRLGKTHFLVFMKLTEEARNAK